ncbi:MAG TPA: hypothetical protein VK960_06440 [Acidimicrobiia bacterium]|nr:hypothetical protein [Acidimicrobiia bacterium]
MRFSAAEAVDAAGMDRDLLADVLPRIDPSRVPVWAASRWFRIFWAKGITAVAMPWGIYLHPDRLDSPLDELGPLVVHELAHLDQWRRLGPLGWARAYLGDYLRGRRRGMRHHEAYRSIGLEVEARDVAGRLAG